MVSAAVGPSRRCVVKEGRRGRGGSQTPGTRRRGSVAGLWEMAAGMVGSAAPVSKLNQSISAFAMRKDRVSSWMEMPQRPAVS